MIAHIIRQYDFNLRYAEALVHDLTEIQMTQVPAHGLVNHPAFTLGHLVTGSAMMAEDLGAPYKVPAGWAELFQRKGPNDSTLPETDVAAYPSKSYLLDELEHQHEKVKALLLQADEQKLGRHIQWRFSDYMPTLYDTILFFCINHEAMHLGQLAAWRRAMDLSPALRTL